MKVPVLAWLAAIVWVVCWNFAGEEPYQPADPPDWVEVIRDDFSASVSRFGGDGAALLPGLVLGDTRSIPETLTAAMRVTSLAHLTAVSGANCAVIVGLVYGLVALAGLGIWWRAGIAAAALVAFVVLVGAEPSVIRAAIMACLALVALASGRPTGGVAILSAAVIIALVWSPSLSHSIGFALSVAATFGLLVLTHPLRELLGRWMPDRIALILAVPLAAQFAVQPLLLVFAPSIPTYGVIANILAEPLAPIATVLGLLALVTSPLPWLSLPVLACAWLASTVIAAIARIGSALPMTSIPWPTGGVGIALAVVCTALAVWALLTKRGVVAAVAGVLVIGALSTTVGAHTISWAQAPRDWSVAQCDVGQGDALVMRDGSETVLIDTGRDENALRACLTSLGVGQIALLVLTHFDIDHVGAYRVVVGRVASVVHGPTDGFADEQTLREFRNAGAAVTQVERGARGTAGGWSWSVLWPTRSIEAEAGNPSSVVTSFTSETSLPRVVDLGDLPAREQEMMVGLGGIGPVDIVKVSHHGSKDQFPGLYERLRAGVALVGVGRDNEYGHPTEFALALLASTGSAVIRSDVNGIGLVERDASGTLRVWTERAG